MRRPLFFAVATASALLATAFWPAAEPDPDPLPSETMSNGQRQVREFAITRAMGDAANPAKVDALLTESNRMRQDLPDPVALQQELKRLLQEADPDEQRMRAYFDAQPDLFAYRSFEQSRPAIERILKVRMARAALLGMDETDLSYVKATLHPSDSRLP